MYIYIYIYIHNTYTFTYTYIFLNVISYTSKYVVDANELDVMP